MRLVFTIHAIITLLMSKPAMSQTCDNVNGSYTLNCPKKNMYFRKFEWFEGKMSGKCCELDDPSYANQVVECSYKRSRTWMFLR